MVAQTTPEAALAWIESGRAVIPIPTRSKAPVIAGWPDLRLDELDVSTYFTADSNIGVLLGEASRGLVDIDLDTGEAVAAAAHYFPRTFTYGRQSRPASHLFYVCPGIATRKFQHGGSTLLEVRSDGCQTVIPPSIHPSGEAYRVEAGSTRAIPLSIAEIESAAGRTAAAALLARHWSGGRHDAALALAGALRHSGWPVAAVEAFVAAVCDAAGDEERRDRLRAVRDTFESAGNTSGWPTLATLFDESIISRLREWLAITDFPALTAGEARSESDTLDTIRAADVAPEPVSWLWPSRFARGKVSMLSGDPGLGKSLITLALAAHVSRGRPWPVDNAACPVGDVVLLSAEDDAADTIRPRLDAAGADVSRVHIVTAVRTHKGRRYFDLRDIALLDDLLGRLSPALLVIDPISAYLGGTDSHRSSDVRALLMPLTDIAMRRRVAVLVVSHLNKGSGPAMYRTTGSLAFTAAARAVYVTAKDQDDPDRRLLLPIKNNLGDDVAGFAYRITAADGLPLVQWEDKPVIVTAEEALGAADSEERSARREAVEFLDDLLRDGPVDADEVAKAAKAAGLSMRTVKRAKADIGVKSTKADFSGRWRWTRPEECQAVTTGTLRGGASEECQNPYIGTVGTLRDTWHPSQDTHEECQSNIYGTLRGSVADSPPKSAKSAEECHSANGRESGTLGTLGTVGAVCVRCNHFELLNETCDRGHHIGDAAQPRACADFAPTRPCTAADYRGVRG